MSEERVTGDGKGSIFELAITLFFLETQLLTVSCKALVFFQQLLGVLAASLLLLVFQGLNDSILVVSGSNVGIEIGLLLKRGLDLPRHGLLLCILQFFPDPDLFIMVTIQSLDPSLFKLCIRSSPLLPPFLLVYSQQHDHTVSVWRGGRATKNL